MFLALFRKLLHATMSDMSTKRKSNDDSHNGKNNFSNIIKKKRTTINVSSSMLTFLREPRIESFMSEFKIKPFDDVSGVMRKSYDSFQTKKRHASWKPFLQLKELLTSDKAIEPLTRSHHRLFLKIACNWIKVKKLCSCFHQMRLCYKTNPLFICYLKT